VKLVHRVPADAQPARLDRYLADQVGLSRARIKDAFDAGAVRVDGKRAKKGDRIAAGSEITAELPEESSAPVPQPDLPLSVLREDASFLVLDKPAGMPSHPLEEGEKGTLGNALIARYPECAQASEDARECGLAHRLDVETSGAMVAARSREAYLKLREAFGARTVEKRYLALVGGAAGEGGEIEIPIAHHPKNARKMIACPTEEEGERLKARPALSRYKVLERLGDFTLVEVEIPTGVMHQIRVHLAAIGAPVAGDALYGGPPIEGLSRQFLHAARLAFPHPATGERVEVDAPLPAELQAVIEKLRLGT
jgi:23S rRNA pseudouridine1911/1915/1917 synthase